jgi:hypothetical protein
MRILGFVLASCICLAVGDQLSAGPGDKTAPESPSTSTRDYLSIARFIDEQVELGLREKSIPPSPPCDDAEFLRRVYLDLVGRIPNRQQALAFLASKDPDKRRKLVDELLANGGYGEHFAVIWRNLIVPREEGSKDKPARDIFVEWLSEQFRRNRRWDEIVIDMLTAEGNIQKTPQTGFILANSDNFMPQPSKLADATARFFWGIQLRCAECHDHPFAQWKQNDFWGTAAFFSRVRHTGFKAKMPGITETRDETAKETPLPGAAIAIPTTAGKHAGKVVKARFLKGSEPDLGDSGPIRPSFAKWATAADHPYFAKATVNRWWAHFFGRGIVQPLDGFDESNPPSHPELLDRLAREFADSGFDLKHLCRCIVNSKAYQRTSRALPENENDTRAFSHMAVKALSPEVLYQAVAVVMGADPKTGKGQSVTLEPRGPFVRAFRPLPESGAADSYGQGIPQFLKLLNGPLLHQKAPVLGLTKTLPNQADAVEAIYLTVLSRRPTDAETQLMAGYLRDQPDLREGYAGVLWILLNTSEFALNH